MRDGSTFSWLDGRQRRSAAYLWLLANHLDNWGPTFIIALLALVVHDIVNWATLHLALALAAGYWLAFALNDYYDAPYDALAPAKARRNYFVIGRMNGRLALTAGLTLIFITVAFFRFGGRGIVLLGISLFVTWGYSAPPLRFKSRPVLDLLVHAGFVESYPYIVCLLAAGVAWEMVDVALLVILALSSLTAQLEQQLRDFDVDGQSGGSFATWFGRRHTRRLLQGATMLLFVVAAASALLGVVPAYIAVYGLIASPALLHRFGRGGAPRSEPLIFALVGLALLYTLVLAGFYLLYL